MDKLTAEQKRELRKEKMQIMREFASIARIGRFMTDEQWKPYEEKLKRIEEIDKLLNGG